MKYSTTSKLSVREVVNNIKVNSELKDFTVTNIFDVNSALSEKGVFFASECFVLDLCNPHNVLNLLSTNMDMSMILPCKISVYDDDGITVVSMLKQKQLYRNFTDILDEVAHEAESTMVEIINTSV